ncbi:dihydrolipoyl dehydrogenase family protein [Cupriavidus gilardii]|uniref:dihydrolipoyl dehydrogenase family protein n=1 Tax=Cupriavidus gilardii TaxID=82541 RepID=UPI001572B972|nr:FAD-dependent oxidoreductase [Cupriavidus gilardii]NSX03838.1 FAD-dependent oxidoreductase [Cupriavidus gilardii]
MTKRQAGTDNERKRASKVSAEPRMERVPRGKSNAGAGRARQADFVVIGGGSAGVAAAMRAASHGASVILVEREQIGGTCVNRGCIPKKMLSYGATWAAILSGCLSHTGGREDWSDAIVRVKAEMARLHASYTQRLQEAGVQVLRGEASVSAPGQVRVGGDTLQARRILIATGSRPTALPVPGAELASTSDDVFEWNGVPASLVVIGGGYIAVEMASILSRYGVKVDMLVRESRLLENFDEDIANALAEALTAKGVRLHLNTDVTLLDQANGALEVCYRQVAQGENGGKGKERTHSVRAQAALAAIGREPNLDGLGLEALGVARGQRGLRVDRQFRTSVRGIHAIGDVTEGLQLTPVAIAQGRWLADRLFGRRGERADFDVIPTAVFCEPAIGSVGLTEAAAIEAAGKPERIGTRIKRFVSLENRFAGNTMPSVMKIVYNARSGRVLGVHMLDNAAPEIAQSIAVALRLGVRLSHLETTMRLHPTVAEELFG